MKRIYMTAVTILCVLVGTMGMANADLIHFGDATYNGSDYKMIFDNTQDLIWLDYTQGKDTWANQMAWASSLNDSGTLTYTIFSGFSVSWAQDSGWRLPSALNDDGSGPDLGTGASSEMALLFATPPDLDTPGFDNLITSYYWSETEYAPGATTSWLYNFGYSYQGTAAKTYNVRAIAVHEGQVTETPLPAGIWLLGTGVASLLLWSRRRDA